MAREHDLHQEHRAYPSDDATIPQQPDNTGSSAEDLDQERDGGMSGGLGDPEPQVTLERVDLDDAELLRQLELVKSTLLRLEAGFVNQRVNTTALEELDNILALGVRTDVRSLRLVTLLDALRTYTAPPYIPPFSEAMLAGLQAQAAIDELIAQLSVSKV